MAAQADRTEAGEAHGKSCHLEDVKREGFVFFRGVRGGSLAVIF